MNHRRPTPAGLSAALVLACLVSPALHAAPPPETPPPDSASTMPFVAPQDDLAQARREADIAYTQATKALEQREWLEAELLLERALMFYPAHAEALLQLALLLAQRDDFTSAQALIHVLLDDPATPPEHRQRLQALMTSVRTADAATQAVPQARSMPPRTVIGWGLAYSSNPLAATDVKQLVLTLPQGDFLLPLRQRSKAGSTGQVQLYHRWDQGLELQAATQNSNATGAHTAQRATLMAPLAQFSQALQRPLYASLALQQTLDGSRRQTANLHWQSLRDPEAPAAQQPTLYSLGVFSETQTHRNGWTLRAQHNLQARATGPSTLAWAEYEHTRGSSPNALRLGLQGQWALAPGWQLHAYSYAQADSAGYSPLLENNKSRRIVTGYLALERQLHPDLWGGQLGATLHGSRRWSNLPLFAWKDQGISLNWQRQWR